jgi:4-hydroxybenzoate polyprenyltransferase
VAGAVNAGVNVFNDIEDYRLDERLRRGIKGGEMKPRW